MRDVQGSHPSPGQLAAFDGGALAPDERASIEQHVATCAICCERLDALPDDPLVALLRAPEPLAAAATRSFTEPSSETPLPVSPVIPESPPELIDHPRYRIIGVLGSGGMGTVFKAEHRLMERIVALKVIRHEWIAKPETVERFRLEVKAAARLAHPNIVTAHDADQAGNVHFLVMEYVEGESLERNVQRRGALPVAEASDCIRQAALGLHHAFERGMVHRDIKPANLLLQSTKNTKEEEKRAESADSSFPSIVVKIADFGLARFASERPSGTMTPQGTVIGTPDYVAPEQALEPSRADIRADIYSLGCTLYHLLAGQPPFPGGTALQKVLAHQQQAPKPLREVRPDAPAQLVGVVGRMMAKEPVRRYQTPREVAVALAPFAGVMEPVRPVARWRRRVALMAYVLLMVLIGFGAWSMWREKPAPGDGNVRRIGGTTSPFSAVAFGRAFSHALAAGPDHALQLWDLDKGEIVARLEGHRDTIRSVAFSPDFSGAVSGGDDKLVILWDLKEQRPVSKLAWHQTAVRSVVYTHDPRHVLSASADGDVALWEIGKLEPKRTFHNEGGAACIALDRFGGRIMVAGPGPTFRRWEYENQQWQLKKQTPGHPGASSWVAWSYDARFLLSGGQDRTLRLWRAMTGKQLAVFEGHESDVACATMTRNDLLALSGDVTGATRLWDVLRGEELAHYTDHAGAVLAVRFDLMGRRMASSGADGTFVVRDLPVYRDGMPSDFLARAGALAMTADGRLLAAAADADAVTLHDVVPDKEKPVARESISVEADSRVVYGIALTPDGKRLATGGWEKIVRVWDVAEAEGRGTCMPRCALQGHTAAVRGVALSADGQTLASSSDDGTVRLWDVPTSGQRDPSEARAILTGHTGAILSVALSTDGRTLLSAGVDGTVRIWDVLSGKERHKLTGHRGEVRTVALSPDGQTAASGGADYTVRLWNVDSGTEGAVLTGHLAAVAAAAFGGDGLTLASASEDKAIKLWNIAAANQRGTLGPPPDAIVSLAFRADGHLLAALTDDGEILLWNVP